MRWWSCKENASIGNCPLLIVATYIKSKCTECTETLVCATCSGTCPTLSSIFGGATAVSFNATILPDPTWFGCVDSGVVSSVPPTPFRDCDWSNGYIVPPPTLPEILVSIYIIKSFGVCKLNILAYCRRSPICYAVAELTLPILPALLTSPITLQWLAGSPICASGVAGTITFSY